MKMLQYIIPFFLLWIGLTFVQPVSAQCPMCRANVESNMNKEKAGKGVAKGKGLNTGILYLLSLPYLLVGGFGCYYWYSYKQKQKMKMTEVDNTGANHS